MVIDIAGHKEQCNVYHYRSVGTGSELLQFIADGIV